MRKQFFARQKYFKSMIIKSIKERNDEIKYLIVKIRIARLSYTKNYSIMNNRTKYSIFVDIQKIKIKFKLPIHL